MGELVGIVPRKLDVSTLLNIVRKYADINEVSDWAERCFSRGNGTGIRSCTSFGRCDPNGGQAVVGSRGYHREVC